MSVIDNIKEIAGLIKKVGDIELYRKIIELEGELIELTREKRNLEERVADLGKQLEISRISSGGCEQQSLDVVYGVII